MPNQNHATNPSVIPERLKSALGELNVVVDVMVDLGNEKQLGTIEQIMVDNLQLRMGRVNKALTSKRGR